MDDIKYEAWRKEQAQKEVSCNDIQSFNDKLDCEMSENNVIQSETSKINSLNVDSNTENNDDIKYEEGKEKPQKHEPFKENEFKDKLDCNTSKNNLIQSESAKSNCSSLNQNVIKS